MKRHTLTLAPLLAVIAGGLLASGCTKSDLADPNADAVLVSLSEIVATCARADGQVELRRKGQAYWEPIAEGAIFRPGDWVRTKSGSFARVVFKSGASLELEEEAIIEIDLAPSEDGKGNEALVAVERGTVRGSTATAEGKVAAPIVLRGKDGKRVRLASAEDADKPAEYRLTTGKTGTEVAVTKGRLRLSSGDRSQAVAQGQGAALGGEKSLEVIELISYPASQEPGIDARFFWARGLEIPIRWRAVEGAKGYRLQVARDLSFQRLEVNAELEGTRFTFTPKKDGIYTWRVASKDAEGRVGEFGFVRRIFCEREVPTELLVAPEGSADFPFSEGAPNVTFAWQSAASAKQYRLVLGRGEDVFKTTVASVATAEQTLTLPIAEPGTYYWGVFIEKDGLLAPIFLEPRRLTIRKVPKANLKTPDSIDKWGG